MCLSRNLHHKVCNAQMQPTVYAKAHHAWLEDCGGAVPPAHWQHAVSCWPSWTLPRRLPLPVLPAWHGLPPSVKQPVTLQLDTGILDCSVDVWPYNAGLAIGNATMQRREFTVHRNWNVVYADRSSAWWSFTRLHMVNL